MYPLFALMLPDWRSMHCILNCSSYLKYRLCVSLRFNLSWHDFTANIKYGITGALSLWHKYNVIAYTVVIHGGLDTRVETRCSGGFSISCLALKSSFIFKYSWSFLHTVRKLTAKSTTVRVSPPLYSHKLNKKKFDRQCGVGGLRPP